MKNKDQELQYEGKLYKYKVKVGSKFMLNK